MDQEITPKKYPTSTSDVAKMLGIHGPTKDLPMGTIISHSDLPVANLPVADSHSVFDHNQLKDAHQNIPVHTDPNIDLGAKAAHTQAKASPFIAIAKAAAPFAAVFIVGLFLYFFFFSGVNFSEMFQSKPSASTPQQSALQQLEQQDLVAYQIWIKGFYYDVTDAKILDPEADNSGNGLTNFEKYLLGLNPKAYDTLGLGEADSQAISQGINPLTGAQLTDAQKAAISKYVDMESVMNRLALYNLQNPGRVAGASVNSQGQSVQPMPVNYGTGQAPQTPQNPPAQQSGTAQYAPVQTGADLNSLSAQTSGININTNIPAHLDIPDLKVSVPIIWTTDPKYFDQDLQIGVVHYPGTALPGQLGTAYISGHSSNYVWAKGDYNHVFTHLGDLNKDASFKITVVDKNGKDIIFHYVVISKQEYLPTDQAQFMNSDKSVVALSTCWPVGSTAKRMVVFGLLTQVEK